MDDFTNRELLAEIRDTEGAIEDMENAGVNTDQFRNWLDRLYAEADRRDLR